MADAPLPEGQWGPAMYPAADDALGGYPDAPIWAPGSAESAAAVAAESPDDALLLGSPSDSDVSPPQALQGAAYAPSAPQLPAEAPAEAPVQECSPAAAAAAALGTSWCPHCLERLREMRGSDGVQCQGGARKWLANWKQSARPCFGACLAPEFCAEHGFPLASCCSQFPDSKHNVFVYRGSWVKQRVKRELEGSSGGDSDALLSGKRQRPEFSPVSPPAPCAQPSPPAPQPTLVVHAPPPATVPAPVPPANPLGTAGIGAVGALTGLSPPIPTGRPCERKMECFFRIQKLRSAEWVTGDPAAVARLKVLEDASVLACQGFCRTPYACRVHWCPAEIKREGTASRYKCTVAQHDFRGKKGRHHADFPFYCDDPACCNGKWYSRDETHRRRHTGKAAPLPADKMLAMADAPLPEGQWGPAMYPAADDALGGYPDAPIWAPGSAESAAAVAAESPDDALLLGSPSDSDVSPPQALQGAAYAPSAPQLPAEAPAEAPCQGGARKWLANWKQSARPCFGACLAPEFCAEHGFPLASCCSQFPDSKHNVFVYRGSWVKQRVKRELEGSSGGDSDALLSGKRQRPEFSPVSPPAPCAQPSPPAPQPTLVVHAPPPAAVPAPVPPANPLGTAGIGAVGALTGLSPPIPTGRPCERKMECFFRIQKLRSAEWVTGDPAAVARLKVLEDASVLACQGFCRTPYACRVHWCPAEIKREGTASRYKCTVAQHDFRGKKGRHHADFPFYCDDPACCNGKWYSRDETHRRRHTGKAAPLPADKMLSVGGETRPNDQGQIDAESDGSSSESEAGAGPEEQARQAEAQRKLGILAKLREASDKLRGASLVEPSAPLPMPTSGRRVAVSQRQQRFLVAMALVLFGASLLFPLSGLVASTVEAKGTRMVATMCWSVQWAPEGAALANATLASGCSTCVNVPWSQLYECPQREGPRGLDSVSATAVIDGRVVRSLAVRTAFGELLESRARLAPLSVQGSGRSGGMVGTWSVGISPPAVDRRRW
eukprot:m51a1_g13733 hypothetical protein (1005) ;mRNA; r:145321-149173